MVLIVVLQLLLLYRDDERVSRRGDRGAALPAAVASSVCFVLILGLLRYVYRLDKLIGEAANE